MEDPMLLGKPFEVGALWPASLLLDFPDSESIFEALTTDLGPLEPLPKDNVGHLDLHMDLPELTHVDDALEPPSEELERTSSGQRDPDTPPFDAWDFNIDQCDELQPPRFHTWETFEKRSVPGGEQSAYLSEAGPAAFDAALQSVEKSIGVLPPDFTLRAMCSLALGRSSGLYQWSDDRNGFVQTVEGARTSGMSLACSQSLAAVVLDLGNMTVRLRTFAESPRSSRACPAAMALRSCVGLVINAVEASISSSAGRIRSFLQLQQLVDSPSKLVKIMTTLVTRTRPHKTDEALIAALSELVHEYAESESRFCAVLRTILARVSVPWLESLLVDLGLHANATGHLEECSPEDPAVVEDRNRSVFLNADDANLINVTKQAVCLLRKQCPDHALLLQPRESMAKLFQEQNMNPRGTEDAARQYEAHITKLLLRGENEDEREQGGSVNVAFDSFRDDPLCDSDSQLSYIAQIGNLMSLEPGLNGTIVPDTLRELAVAALMGDHDIIAASGPLDDLDISPIEHIRPFVRTQHKLVNSVLLRQLVRHHNLRQQLEHQRAFQLLGNGSFAARLSKALFDKDVQSAERRRGVVPTADDMGLRVGATKDQRWPPASSELQLSLMGLLNDATSGKGDVALASTAPQSQLSFAIRELPEEEIEQVLDPHSIYALDFLRIQYTTHAPVSAVITPASLQQYDAVFRYLLKLLRLLHVTADLPRTIPGSRYQGTRRSTLAFAQRARQFVTALTGHVMSVGIAPPWQTFTAALRLLERNLRIEDEKCRLGFVVTMDIEGLRQLHESCLDRIRVRLFLKKKQEKLRVALENVLSSILRCATTLQTEATNMIRAEDYVMFSESLQHFIEQLSESAGKLPRRVTAADAEDLDMMRLLLAKLNWNGFYTGSGSHKA